MDHSFTSDERLRKAERLLKRSQFKSVERKRARKGGRSLVIYAAANGLEWSRVGLTVSRKAGNAVRRNKWKRRLREIFRRNKGALPVGYDLVVIVRSSTRQHPHPDLARLRHEFVENANKAAQRFATEQADGD